MYQYLICFCTFWTVKSYLCIPWSRYLCMYVHHKSMYACMCVYRKLCMCVCMYIRNLCICVCVYVGFSCIYVCGHFYVYQFLHVYRISNFMFGGASLFIKIPFVKVVDFAVGDVMRGHGHFWWIYPPGARSRYATILLDFRHTFELIHKNTRFC